MTKYLVLLSFLSQSTWAEILLATGQLDAAARGFDRVTAARVEHFYRDGLSPAAAARELGATFTSPKDRAYLKDLVAGVPEPDRPVKLRAVERTTDGYRVTAPDGRLFTLTRAARYKFGAINEYPFPGPTEGAEAYLNVVRRALAPARAAHLPLRALFGARSANAVDSAVTKAIVTLGAVAVAALWATSGSSKTVEPSLTVDAYLRRMTNICEQERFAKAKFEDTETAKFLDLSIKQNVYTAELRPTAKCDESFDRLYAKNQKDISDKFKLERGDLKKACDRGQEFATCVKQLRAKDEAALDQSHDANTSDAAPATSK